MNALNLKEVPKERQAVFAGINEERKRQLKKWGEQDHSPADWLTILGEELGESEAEFAMILLSKKLTEKYGDACKSHLEAKFGATTPLAFQNSMINFRVEMEQVAALAVSILEHFDKTYAIDPELLKKKTT